MRNEELGKRELVCIVCPTGCSLNVDVGDGVLNITGNRCPRGMVYAKEEVYAPKRVVTATCGISDNAHALRRVPVKSAVPCPREKIPELLADIYKTRIDLPVKAGDIVIADWKNCGIDIVVTRTIA